MRTVTKAFRDGEIIYREGEESRWAFEILEGAVELATDAGETTRLKAGDLFGDPAVRDVPGTATTTTSTAPLVVQERRSHLVGTTCAEDPAAAGC